MLTTQLQPDTIIEGPFWPEPVRVLRARQHGSAVQIEAVGIVESKYYDQTISLEQLEAQVQQRTGQSYLFNAQPTLFRLAVEALRRIWLTPSILNSPCPFPKWTLCPINS